MRAKPIQSIRSACRSVLWGKLLFLPPALAAQGAVIEGTITAAAGGQPVSRAVVSLTGSARVAETDEKGRYRLAQVPSGRQTLLVRAIGWRRLERSVDIVAGARITVDVTLDREAVVLSELVVSASREERRKSETATSVGVVDAGSIIDSRPHHAGDIIGRVAGAWVVNLGGEGHMTSIRQPITTKPVYTFLEDGVPIRSTGFFNHNGLYEINIPQADRVEVIKGPGTAVFGSDAVGGVVSVFTRDPSERPEGIVSLEGGRFGYGRALGTASSTWGRDAMRADLNITRSDGFRDEAPYQRQSAMLRWDHAMGNRGRLKTVVAFSRINQDSDGGSELTRADFTNNLETNYNPITYRRVKAVRVSSAYDHRTESSLLSATVYGRYNSLDIMPSWQLSFDPQIWSTSNESYGVQTRYRRTIQPLRTNLSVGVDLEYSPGHRTEQRVVPEKNGLYYTGFTLADIQYDYDVSFRQAAPYLQAEISPVSRVHLDLGLRADFVGYDYSNDLTERETGNWRRPASTSVSYRRLNPKLGVAVGVGSGLSMFAAYRAAFRVPSESQLFRQGRAVSTVDLVPVKADNYEAGIRAGIGSVLSLEGTVYRLDITDDILTFQDPATGLRTATNAGATEHRGVELGASVLPTRHVRFDGSLVRAKHTYKDWRPSTTLDFSGNEIELAPRTLGRASITVTPGEPSGVSVTAEWIHEGGYWMDPENTTRYEGYDLGSIFARVPVGRGFELSARVNNIANVRFAETTSFTALQGTRFRPGSPRACFFAVQYAFGGK